MRTKLIALLTLSFLALTPMLSNAQLKSEDVFKNRVKLSYGDASYISFATAMFSSLINGPGDFKALGAISLGYRRLSNNSRWALGGDFSYVDVRETFKNGVKINFSFFAVVPTAEFYYFKTGLFRLYSTLGVGTIFTDDGSFGTAFQINPVAVRIGSGRFAGFAEVGFGYKGIANLGFEYAF